MRPNRKVQIGLNHGAEDLDGILISHLVGVEPLRAGQEAAMLHPKDAVHVATPGFADKIGVTDCHFPSRIIRNGRTDA